jgi:hypothetical protein
MVITPSHGLFFFDFKLVYRFYSPNSFFHKSRIYFMINLRRKCFLIIKNGSDCLFILAHN